MDAAQWDREQCEKGTEERECWEEQQHMTLSQVALRAGGEHGAWWAVRASKGSGVQRTHHYAIYGPDDLDTGM